MPKYLTLDSNIFIAYIKGNETYSSDCGRIIQRIGTDFILVEPSIIFAEVGNAVLRNIDLDTAREEIQNLRKAITFIQVCDIEFCAKAGMTGGQYNIYSIDSIYFQTALDHNTILISLDEEEFITRIKTKGTAIEVYHVKDFPY